MAKNTANVGNKTGILPAGTTVWKKVEAHYLNHNGLKVSGRCVLEMVVVEDGLVPYEAKKPLPTAVYNHNNRKCRVPLVYVKAVHGTTTGYGAIATIPAGATFHAIHDGSEYKVGELRRPDFWNTSKDQCAAGIHCFRTKVEAESY